MQPISLKLENFGPYESSLIDFSNYYAQSLFLITGKTGAGKTTIFDGMSYALYGSTSGGLRQGKEMRSNFASLGQKTKVTFTFKQSGKTYQVEREPEQLVKKLRGEGLREQPASVKLTIFDENKQEINQLTKQKDVGPFLSELIQLNEQQFSQIVMLPQGEFRRFLIADSDSKEKVLRKLFNTYFYQEIANSLREKKKELEAGRKKGQQELNILVSQITWQADFNQRLSEEMPLSEVLKLYKEQEQQEVADSQQLIDSLKISEQNLATHVEKMAVVKKEIEYIESYQQVLQQLEILEESEESIRKDKEQIYLLKKVQGIEPTYHLLKNLLGEKEESLRKQGLYKTQQIELNESQKKWREQLESLLNQEKVIKEKERQLVEIEAILPLFEKQEKLKKSLVELRESKKETLIQQEKLVFQQEKLMNDIRMLNQLLETKPELLEKQMILQEKIRHTQLLLDKVIVFEQTKERLQQLELSNQNDKQKLEEITDNLERLTTSVKQAKSDWAKAQIAQLSLDLIEGEPCLVCGAKEHPNPFHKEELSKEDLTRLEWTLEAFEKKLSEVKEEKIVLLKHQEFQVKESQELEELLLTQVEELNKSLVNIEDQTTWQSYLKEQNSLVTTELNELLKNLSEMEDKKILEGELQKENSLLTSHLTDQSLLLREIETKEIQLETSYKELLARLPKEETTLTMLLTTKKELEADVSDWSKGLELTETTISTIEKELLINQTTLSNEEEKQENLDLKITKEQETLTRFISEIDISEIELVPLMNQLGQLKQLEKIVQEFEQQQYALTREAKNWEEKINQKEKPDLEPLLKQEEAYLGVIKNYQEQLQQLQHLMTNNQQKITEIENKEASMSEELKILEEITELANVMSGDSDNKLSVERFVLQSYLKRILQRANEKLVVLTNGRYYFELKEESGSYKKKTGLEINIFDDNVGAIRSVNTLSGGESFIAALSLALSLAEIIQEEAGGIKIDAMFIDEGFGSLDEDALEMAIRALESIEGENRIIGIISHVRELKERIPQQLQVISKNGKSSVIERLEFE